MTVSGSPIASVVIPAHDEAVVIERCLVALTESALPGELEIVVVCNGCSDSTADLARAHSYPLRVIETPIASKPHALNLGDSVATSFPRIYLDADVVMDANSIRALAAQLSGGSIHLAAPRLSIDLSHSSWLVRAYFRVWLQLPYARQNLIGSGVYGVSAVGRERFGLFPDTFAEDCFVRLLFPAGEKATVTTSSFRIRAPARVRDLVSTLARQRVGTREVCACYPEITRAERAHQRLALLRLAAASDLWLSTAVYAVIKLRAYGLCLWRSASERRRVWHRDESTRTLLAATRTADDEPRLTARARQ